VGGAEGGVVGGWDVRMFGWGLVGGVGRGEVLVREGC